MKVLRIRVDGTMNEINIDFKKTSILKKLENVAISKGSSPFKELYSWTYYDKNILCYGWYDGYSGFENKHELIPNGISKFLEQESSEILLFGDIFLVCIENNKYINFDVSDYSEVYDFICDGFDECNSSDESDSEEESINEEDENGNSINSNHNIFIINDYDDNESDGSYVCDEEESDDELDEDKNTY